MAATQPIPPTRTFHITLDVTVDLNHYAENYPNADGSRPSPTLASADLRNMLVELARNHHGGADGPGFVLAVNSVTPPEEVDAEAEDSLLTDRALKLYRALRETMSSIEGIEWEE